MVQAAESYIRQNLEPLSLPIEACPVLWRPLSEWQQAIKRDGLSGTELSLSYDPAVFFSPRFLRALVERARGFEGITQPFVRRGLLHQAFGPNAIGLAALGPGAAVKTAEEMKGLGADCSDSTAEYLVYPISTSHGGEARSAVHTIEIPLEGSVSTTAQPGRSEAPMMDVFEPHFIWRIAHWSDLLTVNLAMLKIETAAIAEEGRRGQGVEIHPTAVVMRSELGDNVRIGPHATVIDSILQEGVELQEYASAIGAAVGAGTRLQCYAQARGSVIGPNCLLSFQTATRSSLLLGNTTSSAPVISRSVIGDNVFLARGMQLSVSHISNRTIRVRQNGKLIDTEMEMLGLAVGDGARLGAISTPAGFEVPAGYYLVSKGLSPLRTNLPRGVPLIEIDGVFRNLGFKRKR